MCGATVVEEWRDCILQSRHTNMSARLTTTVLSSRTAAPSLSELDDRSSFVRVPAGAATAAHRHSTPPSLEWSTRDVECDAAFCSAAADCSQPDRDSRAAAPLAASLPLSHEPFQTPTSLLAMMAHAALTPASARPVDSAATTEHPRRSPAEHTSERATLTEPGQRTRSLLSVSLSLSGLVRRRSARKRASNWERRQCATRQANTSASTQEARTPYEHLPQGAGRTSNDCGSNMTALHRQFGLLAF
jgi:hypothetical protein